jgi:allantoate deiminase
MVRPIEEAVVQRLYARLEMLAKISEEPDQLTRPFMSPAMVRVNEVVSGWFRDTGLSPWVDGIGNVRAIWGDPQAPRIVIGSHLDTVRNAGKFDGPLGMLSALAVVEQMQSWREKPPFAIEVVGFSDEEGLRFQTAYLGSYYYIGRFRQNWWELKDRDGISMEEAVKAWGRNREQILATQECPKKLLGYLEMHIEQGPLLEVEQCAAGVVSAIAAQSRINITVTGKAGHAGTTPMDLRRDALCAAAEMILIVEKVARKVRYMRATVGQIRVEPSASNVIPSEARFTLDFRHPNTEIQRDALEAIHAQCLEVARIRRVRIRWDYMQQTEAVPMDARFISLLSDSARAVQGKAPRIVSGAGHDGVAMSEVCPVGMLFVRCRQGLSHHPDEYVTPEDIRTALTVFTDAIMRLSTEGVRSA